MSTRNRAIPFAALCCSLVFTMPVLAQDPQPPDSSRLAAARQLVLRIADSTIHARQHEALRVSGLSQLSPEWYQEMMDESGKAGPAWQPRRRHRPGACLPARSTGWEAQTIRATNSSASWIRAVPSSSSSGKIVGRLACGSWPAEPVQAMGRPGQQGPLQDSISVLLLSPALDRVEHTLGSFPGLTTVTLSSGRDGRVEWRSE